MADYWGLDAIALRLGVKKSTVHTWWSDRAFLMYRRRRTGHLMPLWYTNDQLIATWELSQCAKDHAKGVNRNIGRPRRNPDGETQRVVRATALADAVRQRQISAAP
jgi:hypothetical protein